MKNILITFTNAIDPTTGGVERVYHNLVPYFREHGYNVFATYQRKTDYDKNSVYTKAIFMEYSIDNVGYFDKLDKVMMEMAVDIVICPFPSYQLFNYCSRLIDKKVFFHVHNVPSKLMYPSSAKLPVSVSAILSCRPFFILIFLRCIKMKHYGFSRKSIWKNLETFP